MHPTHDHRTPARAERSSASRLASDLRAHVRYRVREACCRDVESVVEAASRGEVLVFTADTRVGAATARRERLAASCAGIALDYRAAADAAREFFARVDDADPVEAQPGDVLLDALGASQGERRLAGGIAQEVAFALQEVARHPREVSLRPGEVSDALAALEALEGPSRPLRALAVLAAILDGEVSS
jgi:hypothetical protein